MLIHKAGRLKGNRKMIVKRAARIDVPGIASVKQATWPYEQTNEDYIDRVIQDESHFTLVATESLQIVGFVDGFETIAQDGTRRWEIDLLAVHPDHRGRGIAKCLVGACAEHGGQRGCSISRSLIHIGNDNSMKVFTSCGYQPESQVCGLYVSSNDSDVNIAIPSNLHLGAVDTINYRGVWLEGELSGDAFAAAISSKTRLGLDIAGATVLLTRKDVIRKALSANYLLIDHYRFWIRHL